MIGYFIVDSFCSDADSRGFETRIGVSNKMDMNLKAELFLPPYLRKAQCEISVGDMVFGIVDDTSGLGVALCGFDGSDFGYFFDSDIQIKKSLTVTDDIKSTDGDVQAKTSIPANKISLKDHWHGYIDSKGQAATPTPSKTQASNTIAPEPEP